MLTAEHSDICVTRIDRNAQGALAFNSTGMYVEYQIINYTRENMYVLDQTNVGKQIPKQLSNPERPNVTIRYRRVIGPRSKDLYEIETTQAHHVTLEIPLSILRNEPVFVESLNIIISSTAHVELVDHPHSKESKEGRMHVIEKILSNLSPSTPLIIIANDPSRKISKLYTEIHNDICVVDVSHYKEEPDTIHICYRDQKLPNDDFRIIKTSFKELMRTSSHTWIIEGITFSINRELLLKQQELARIEHEESFIPTKEYIEELDKLNTKKNEELSLVSQELKETKQRLDTVNRHIKELMDGKYAETAIEIELDKLKLEREKLTNDFETLKIKAEQDRLKFEHDLKAEKEKTTKAKLDTLTAIAKTIAVLIPIGIGIYKLMQSQKASS